MFAPWLCINPTSGIDPQSQCSLLAQYLLNLGGKFLSSGDSQRVVLSISIIWELNRHVNFFGSNPELLNWELVGWGQVIQVQPALQVTLMFADIREPPL